MLVWFGWLFVMAWGIGFLTVPEAPWFLHSTLVVGGGAMLVGVFRARREGARASTPRTTGAGQALLTARLATASWPGERTGAAAHDTSTPSLQIGVHREEVGGRAQLASELRSSRD